MAEYAALVALTAGYRASRGARKRLKIRARITIIFGARENLQLHGGVMSNFPMWQCGAASVIVAMLAGLMVAKGSAQTPTPSAQDLDPKVLAFKLPDQIPWQDDPIGAKTAVLLGDPSKPGLYIMLVKWTPHRMSHPHWHPHDRFITVISGTWWVGTGAKFDPDKTVPLPAGSFVTHFGKQIHYDGEKDSEAVLEIVGEGPATATPAEDK
jgi:quercetin dioxygenase-like cupin family protein